MRYLLLLAAAALHAQTLSFVQTTSGVDIRLAGGAAAAGIQTSFAVPTGATITPGPALGTDKTLYSRIDQGIARLLVAGINSKPLTDGVIATVSAPATAWPFCPVNAMAVDAAGLFVPGFAAAPVAYVPQQPAAPVMQRDFWKYAAPGYRLSYPVYGGEGNALVYLNGLLMLRGADYQLVGTLLQFSVDILSMKDPIVQVIYWH